MRTHLTADGARRAYPADGERTFYCRVCRCRITVDVDQVAPGAADEYGHANNCPHRPASLPCVAGKAGDRMALPDGGGPDA